MKSAIALLVMGTITLSGAAFAAEPDGAKLFNKNCIPCHGKDGKGETDIGEALKITNFTDVKVQERLTEELMIKQMTNGSKDKVTGKDRMPSFKAMLKPEEMKALAKYIRGFKGK